MKLYSFTPTDDLTTLELARIVKTLFVSLIEGIQGQPTRGEDELEIDDAIYDLLPDDLKQYFIEKENVIQSKPVPPSTVLVTEGGKPGQSKPVDGL